MLTRLELFIRREGLKPLHVARRAMYSRQHFLRLRLGLQMATARAVAAVTAACEAESGKAVLPGALFERAEQLGPTATKLQSLHVADLAALDGLLAEVTAHGWAESVLATGIRSETAVLHLLFAGRDALQRAPDAAAEVFRAALLLAGELRDSASELVASLSAHARKGRANALRHLGRFDEALADLTVAGELFAAATYCGAEAAQVEFTRAGVLFKRERWREALIAARTATAQFRLQGDVRRAAHAEIVEAAILFEEGNTEAARGIFHRLRPILRALRDRDALALVWMNLAACAIRLGTEAEARHWLNRASRAFRRSGNMVELLRTRWSMGSYLARFRTPAYGLRLLRRVERAFAERGMHADAACVGLDILELLIDIQSPGAAIAQQTRAITEAFVSAGMAVSLSSALDHLRHVHGTSDARAALKMVRAAVRAVDDAPCHPQVPIDGAGGASSSVDVRRQLTRSESRCGYPE